jgi:hypothetical protein
MQPREGGAAEEEVTESTQTYNGKGVLFKHRYSRYLLRGGAPQEQRPLTRQLPVAVPPAARKSTVPAPVQQQKTGHSVQASHVSSQPSTIC